MDETRFDRWTRGFGTHITRRGLATVMAGGLGAFGFASSADAGKKKKKGKGKKKKSPPVATAPVVNYACANPNSRCGNTTVCGCFLDTSSQQLCMNDTVPPNGITFPPCINNANCGGGTVCVAGVNVCASLCPN